MKIDQRKIWAIVLSAFAVVVLFLVVFANQKAMEAERQRQLVEKYLEESEGQKKAAEVAAAESRRAQAEALQQKMQADQSREELEKTKDLLKQKYLGKEVISLQEEVKKQSRLAEAAQLSAERQRELAIQAQHEAEIQRQLAIQARNEAVRQQQIAEEAVSEANKQIELLKKQLENCQNP